MSIQDARLVVLPGGGDRPRAHRGSARRAALGGLITFALIGAFAGARAVFLQRGPTSPSNSSDPEAAIVSQPSIDVPKPDDAADKDLKGKLTPEQYHITREKGTERAFTGKYWDFKGVGIYHCVCCGEPLFDSKTKYESGTGWPSFYQPIDERRIKTAVDFNMLAARTEVMCKNCGAHLGHVFEDGPKPTGLRYCLNSASLEFEETATALNANPEK